MKSLFTLLMARFIAFRWSKTFQILCLIRLVSEVEFWNHLCQSSLHGILTCFWQLLPHNHCTLETVAWHWLLTQCSSNIFLGNRSFLGASCLSFDVERRGWKPSLVWPLLCSLLLWVGGVFWQGRFLLPAAPPANFNLDLNSGHFLLLLLSHVLPIAERGAVCNMNNTDDATRRLNRFLRLQSLFPHFIKSFTAVPTIVIIAVRNRPWTMLMLCLLTSSRLM